MESYCYIITGYYVVVSVVVVNVICIVSGQNN